MSGEPGPIVRQEVVVPLDAERAFALFTERLGDVKPPEHDLAGKGVARTTLEPRAGGSVTDHAPDGTTCRWARVLAFEPPTRLLLAWDISPRWSLEDDPSRASEVEVRFEPEPRGGTRVRIEHRHLDRHGPGWESAAEAVDGPDGWPRYLERFADLACEAA